MAGADFTAADFMVEALIMVEARTTVVELTMAEALGTAAAAPGTPAEAAGMAAGAGSGPADIGGAPAARLPLERRSVS
jgi:hypothetical protein